MNRVIEVVTSAFSSVINNPKRNINVFKYVCNRRKKIFEDKKETRIGSLHLMSYQTDTIIQDYNVRVCFNIFHRNQNIQFHLT